MADWQPIETYVESDERHARGVWVHSHATGKPLYFDSHIGWINDVGQFVDDNGDFGWPAEDYTHWMPLPTPPVQS